MIKTTYGQMKSELARVGGDTGFNVSDTRLMAQFNQATMELMNEGDFPGVVDRYLFNVSDGNIVLPSFLDRALGFTINKIPYTMRSPWYEFVEYGPGTQVGSENWISAIIDRDEIPVQIPLGTSTSYTLYTVGEVDERIGGVRPYLTVRGRLSNGRDVRSYYTGTGYIYGERIGINGDTPDYTTVGTALFREITSVIKPATAGYVELWGTDGTTATKLATYGPDETNPSYHAYFLPSFKTLDTSGSNQVLVRGRRRFYEIKNDDDPVIISNLQAMKAMLMAIRKFEVSDMDGYAACKITAVDLMKKEALAYRGKAKAPGMSFQNGGAIGDMPYIR